MFSAVFWRLYRMVLGIDIEPEEMDLAMKYMDRMIQLHKWTTEGAAAAAACAKSESDFRTSVEGDKKIVGHAKGLHQWRLDRFDDTDYTKDILATSHSLLGFAKAAGKDWTDFDLQVDFVNDETLRRSQAEKHWRYCLTIEEGTACGQKYEVYEGPIQPARKQCGYLFLEEYNRRKSLAESRPFVHM
jgi:hypothetical protein